MKDTKKQIQEKLLEMLKTQDIYTIKVKALTEALQVSRGTFYLYYDSAFAVLQEIEDDFFDQLQNSAKEFWRYPLDEKDLNTPHPVLLNVILFLDKNRRISEILWGAHGDAVFQSRCKRMIRDQFFPAQISHSLYPEDTDMVVAFKVGGHLETLNCWWANNYKITAEKLAVKTYQLMFSDILLSPKRKQG